MGEAARRRRSIAHFEQTGADLHRCPVCRSRRTAVATGPAMALSAIPTLYGVCADCSAVWEAFPPDWKHDVCEAEPCDNCAFRPGAPEHADTAEWRAMLADLKQGREFRCHKGGPIKLDLDAGTAEFDAQWVTRHGRICAGFHRAIMTRPEWFECRFGIRDGAAPEVKT